MDGACWAGADPKWPAGADVRARSGHDRPYPSPPFCVTGHIGVGGICESLRVRSERAPHPRAVESRSSIRLWSKWLAQRSARPCSPRAVHGRCGASGGVQLVEGGAPGHLRRDRHRLARRDGTSRTGGTMGIADAKRVIVTGENPFAADVVRDWRSARGPHAAQRAAGRPLPRVHRPRPRPGNRTCRARPWQDGLHADSALDAVLEIARRSRWSRSLRPSRCGPRHRRRPQGYRRRTSRDR